MGAPAKRASSGLPSPRINVTPLVDIVLVLLIIFMVITPALNEGEQVELPKIFAPDKKPKDLSPIEVTIAPGGITRVGKERIEAAALRAKLVELHELTPDRKVILKADTSIPYGDVRRTFAMMQKIGFRGVALKVVKRQGKA